VMRAARLALLLFLVLEGLFGTVSASQAPSALVTVTPTTGNDKVGKLDGLRRSLVTALQPVLSTGRLFTNLLGAAKYDDGKSLESSQQFVNTNVRDAWFELLDQSFTLLLRWLVLTWIVNFFEIEVCHKLKLDTPSSSSLYAYPLNPTTVEDSVFDDVYAKADKKSRFANAKVARHLWLTPENVPQPNKVAGVVSLLETHADELTATADSLPVRRTTFRADPSSWRDVNSALPGFCNWPLWCVRIFVKIVLGFFLVSTVLTFVLTMVISGTNKQIALPSSAIMAITAVSAVVTALVSTYFSYSVWS